MINSFNEYLFSKFYEVVLNEWMDSTGESATWTYQDTYEDKSKLCSILKSTYKACYENTNTILEVYEYTKEYHMPRATNQSGGKFYQIHEANWRTIAKADAERAVEEEEGRYGNFAVPFLYEEDIKVHYLFELLYFYYIVYHPLLKYQLVLLPLLFS